MPDSDHPRQHAAASLKQHHEITVLYVSGGVICGNTPAAASLKRPREQYHDALGRCYPWQHAAASLKHLSAATRGLH